MALYWQKYADAKPQWPLTPNSFDKTRRAFDTFGHALKVYENIRLNDPTGPRADDALMATATAYFMRGRYEDADYHFDLLRREYPKSEHQFEAHLLGLQCKLRKYQGPDYDGKALEKAEKLSEQLLMQFPDKIDKERDRITKMRAEVAAQRALRNWKMAEYYAKGSHYGAAKHYYQKLIETHPETKLAEQARTELDKIGKLPDEPPQRLEWLVNLFPESDEMAAVATAPASDTTRR
ncbi:MAG: outer membrane protein assembly factor BamD [Pirellulales bacterium]